MDYYKNVIVLRAEREKDRERYIGKKGEYSDSQSITSGD
jgi:hypothetical protein